MFQYVTDQSDCVRMNPFDGVTMHALEAEKMTMSLVEMEPNSVIPEHSHPHEQVGLMLEGEAEFVIDGRCCTVRAGQMWRLPGGTPHKVSTGDQSMRALDVFHPVREDFRPSHNM